MVPGATTTRSPLRAVAAVVVVGLVAAVVGVLVLRTPSAPHRHRPVVADVGSVVGVATPCGTFMDARVVVEAVHASVVVGRTETPAGSDHYRITLHPGTYLVRSDGASEHVVVARGRVTRANLYSMCKSATLV